MSGIVVDAVGADLTADGGTDGSAQVASSTGFFVNARVWLSATDVVSRECRITAISGGTLFLQFVDGPPNYGVSDLSAYTTGAGARVDQSEQFVAGAALPTLTDVMRTDGQIVTSAVPITAPSIAVAQGLELDYTTSASAGNNPSGRSSIANGTSSKTITSSLVTATSIVQVQLETVGAGVSGLVVVPADGSFDVTSVDGTGTATSTTADAAFSWVITRN
jgi:hypothetical protein